MSLPFLRSQGSLGSGSGAISPGIPPGIQPNDILVMLIVTPFGNSVPDGSWSLVLSNTIPRVSIYWKRTTGAEPAVTVSDTGAYQIARIFAFGGCVTSGDPFDTGAETSVTFDDADTDVTIPGDSSASTDTMPLIVTGVYAKSDALTDPDAFVGYPSWVNSDLANLSDSVSSANAFYLSGGKYLNHLNLDLATAELASSGAFGDTVSDAFWGGTFQSLAGYSVLVALIGAAPSYVFDADPITVELQIQDLNSVQEGSAGTLDAEPIEVDLDIQAGLFTHGGGGVATIDTWQWDTPEEGDDFVPIPWYIAHQYSDAGVEDRSKLISAVRVTGKTTDGEIQIHGGAPGDVISREDVEDGTNALATFSIPDAADVTRHERVKMRVRNMSQALVRISGEWDGGNGRDRLDEIVVEGDVHGSVK